ncbi:hypothetical protein ACNI3Q_06885 [Sphingomonas sp. FW199]|uniref:hypothetical protein n=1 Tax=Sphingomonas sp. FW199 TaxID=3400217 RepID=UPI003CEC147B
MRVMGIITAACAIVMSLLLTPSPSYAQAKCKKLGKPKIEHQVDVPREPDSDELVRLQLVSEYCQGVSSYKRWRVLDVSGKLLHQADGEIIPLSAKHGIAKLDFGKPALVMFGKKPGPALPLSGPTLEQALYPGQTGNVMATNPPVVMPLVIAIAPIKPGDSTTVNATIFSGHSYQPKVVEGVGGKAVFGTDRFGQDFRGASIYDGRTQEQLRDLLFPQIGGMVFQNMTAPDGSAISVPLNSAGDPAGTAVGLIELVRTVTIRAFSPTPPTTLLVSRMMPMGPGFPNSWLYTPIDRQGQLIPMPEDVIGLTLLRSGTANDPPIWGAVYRGAKGFEVALPQWHEGKLPLAPRPERYSALAFRDFGPRASNTFVLAGKTAGNDNWGIVMFGMSSPRAGERNSFASAEQAFAAHDQWQKEFAVQARQFNLLMAQQQEAARLKTVADAQALAVATFEKNYSQRGGGCYESYYDLVAPLGDPYLKRWYEKCGIPQHLYGDARRLGVSAEVFARSDQMAASRRAYEADLRRRGANAAAFSNAMAAARQAAGAPVADPWVTVRVTEGGRTTTRVMRQSEYDQRRP